MDSKLRKRRRQNVSGYLFLLPWLTLFALFVVYPFVYGLGISLYDFNFVNRTFIGLANYKTLLGDARFWRSMFATLKMALIIIPGTLALSLWIANTLFYRTRRMQAFGKAAFYMTSIVSEVALVIVWKWIFNPAYGVSATLTDALGMSRINWFGNANLSVPLIAVLVMSFTIAQPVILYSAAMNNIPETYYEAAELDGASRTQQFFHITLPLLKPTTTFILITTTISSLQIFAIPYLLTGGGPDFATTTMLLMIYNNAFEYAKLGYASAMSAVLFIIIAVFAYLQFRLTRSDVQY